MGVIPSISYQGEIPMPFTEHKGLLKHIENFFQTLLSLELEELEFKNLACLNCGFCCKYFSPISVNHEEILRLADFLKLTVKEFKKIYTVSHGGWPDGNTVLKDIPDETGKMTKCVFLKKEKDSNIHLCTVHKARPDACRAYYPSSIFLICRNLWRSKWEKINNVILFPEEMIVYILNEFPRGVEKDRLKYKDIPPLMTGIRLKYKDVPIIMNEISEIKKYIENHLSLKNLSDISYKTPQMTELGCVDCGNCCIFREHISIDREDIKKIADFLKCKRETIEKEYTQIYTDWDGEKLCLKKDSGVKRYMWCTFLDKKENEKFFCRIYPARPESCIKFVTGLEKRFCKSCKTLGVDKDI